MAVSSFGRLDCVVNNAGVGGAFGPLVDIDVADWDYTSGVITWSTFLGLKHGVRRMQPRAGCSIVNAASVAGILGDAGPQAYSGAKAAVIHMGKVFSAEVAPLGTRIKHGVPGATKTPLHPVTSDDVSSAAQPLHDVGRPEHLAEAIYFLASPQAAFITGERIAVDGGLAAASPWIAPRLGSSHARSASSASTEEPPVRVRRSVEDSPRRQTQCSSQLQGWTSAGLRCAGVQRRVAQRATDDLRPRGPRSIVTGVIPVRRSTSLRTF